MTTKTKADDYEDFDLTVAEGKTTARLCRAGKVVITVYAFETDKEARAGYESLKAALRMTEAENPDK